MNLNYDAPSRFADVDEMAAWIERELKPDVFMTAHLQRSASGEFGSREVYERNVIKYLCRVSQRLYGPKGYRSRKRYNGGHGLLPNVVALERQDDCPHLHFLFRRPEWIDHDSFAKLLEDEWLQCPWSKVDRNALSIEVRQAGSHAACYILKEGTEALLSATTSF